MKNKLILGLIISGIAMGGVTIGSNGGYIIEDASSFEYNNGTIDYVSGAESDIDYIGELNLNSGLVFTVSDSDFYIMDGSVTGEHIIDATDSYTEIENSNIISTNDPAITIKRPNDFDYGDFADLTITNSNIYADDMAILFDENNNQLLLEQYSNNKITGWIDGGEGIDRLVLNGIGENIIEDGIVNFEVIESGSINGTDDDNVLLKSYVQLDVMPDSFTNTYGALITLEDYEERLRNNIYETSITYEGGMKIEVNYDGITSEGTEDTGKIIARGFDSSNGTITLVKSDDSTSTVSIIEELLRNDPSATGTSINSIIITKEAPIINPFGLSDELSPVGGWESVTKADRYEDGIYYVDQIYTKTGDTVIDNGGDDDTDTPTSTYAYVRNRVDLDNMNRLDSEVERGLNLNKLEKGEREVYLSYDGTVDGNFEKENDKNKDYDVKTDGVDLSIMHGTMDNLTLGVALGYKRSDVDYEEGSTEDIDSSNVELFGRYRIGDKVNIDGKIGYGHNEHDLETNFLTGKEKGTYDSGVFKTGLEVSYEQGLGEKIVLVPSIGIDYVNVYEGEIEYEGGTTLGSVREDGVIGKLGLSIGSNVDKFKWNAGVNYEYSTEDTYHGERYYTDSLRVEELHYDKNTFMGELNGEYEVFDGFDIKLGYEYELNGEYDNHNVNVGLGFTLK